MTPPRISSPTHSGEEQMEDRTTVAERTPSVLNATPGDGDGEAEVRGRRDASEEVAELLIEDISIDGMCGVY